MLCGWTPITTGNVLAGDDPVVAVVNGTEIHFSQAQAALKRLPKNYQHVPIEEILPRLVDSLIDTHLAAATARIEEMHETKNFHAQMAWIEKQVLQNLMLSKIIDGVATDATMRILYEKEVKKLSTIEKIKASHILLKTEKEAKEVTALLAKGSDFSELAKKRSTGPSASDGGNLGFFSRGQMVPEFEDAAYKLRPGDYTNKAVKTKFGWHVIKVVERKIAEVPSFELMQPKLQNTLFEKTIAVFIKKIRKGAKIALFNLDGTPRDPVEKLN